MNDQPCNCPPGETDELDGVTVPRHTFSCPNHNSDGPRWYVRAWGRGRWSTSPAPGPWTATTSTSPGRSSRRSRSALGTAATRR